MTWRGGRWGGYLVLLLSCTTETIVTEDTPAPVDALEPACAGFAEVWCGNRALCDPVGFASAYGFDAECVERETLYCVGSRFGEGTGLSVNDLVACAAAIDVAAIEGGIDAQCEKWLGWEQGRFPPEPCRMSGTLEDGAPCLSGLQCESGTCRGGAPRDLRCGICGPLVQESESCDANADCSPPFVCASSACRSVGGQGVECDAQTPCRPWLWCEEGRCQPFRDLDEPCNPSALSCAPWRSLACSDATATCRPASATQPIGAPCGQSQRCAYGGVCGKMGSICEETTQDDKACDGANVDVFEGEGPCFEPAVCFGNTPTSTRCRLPDAAACNSVLPP